MQQENGTEKNRKEEGQRAEERPLFQRVQADIFDANKSILQLFIAVLILCVLHFNWINSD